MVHAVAFTLPLALMLAVSNGAVPKSHLVALTDLYHATKGDSWSTTTNWLKGDPCEDLWHGVTCDASNINILALVLNENNLSGVLPESLGDLTDLLQLSLNNNELTGPLPKSFTSLTNMQYLALGSNQISGSLPDDLHRLSQMSMFSVTANQLTGSIPNSIGFLSQLRYLKLNLNLLEGSIPESVGNLTHLGTCDMSHNKLTAVPESLGYLTRLTSLYLNDNALSTVPESLAAQVEYLYLARGPLDLANNTICTIPSGFNAACSQYPGTCVLEPQQC